VACSAQEDTQQISSSAQRSSDVPPTSISGQPSSPASVATSTPVPPHLAPTRISQALSRPTKTPSRSSVSNSRVIPTAVPTAIPVAEPTAVPTAIPVAEPTAVPTAIPVAEPTAVPTATPVAEPTAVPTAIPIYSFLTKSPSTKLTNSYSTKSKKFGTSVAIDRDSIIIGDPNDFSNGTDSGSASIFNRSEGTWVQQAHITADDIYQGYLFGEAVDIDGDTAVIGATGGAKGAVYVFVLSEGIWTQQAKLIDIDTESSAQFGKSVAVSGNILVVGAPMDDAPYTDSGSAFVFTRDDDVWSKTAQLTPSGRSYTFSNNLFGRSVTIDSDRIYVGAVGDFFANGTDSGAVYVFTMADGSWVEESKLHASDGAEGDNFGRSVSVFDDTLVVGSPTKDGHGTDSGAAYVFVRDDADEWSEQTKLIAADGAYDDNFGWSVAAGADIAIVGALNATTTGSYAGSLYTYERTETKWTEQSKLTGTGVTRDDKLGTSVSMSGNEVVAGSPGYTGSAEESGAMHIFTGQLR